MLALKIVLALLLLYPAVVALAALACIVKFRDLRPLLWVAHAICEVPLYILGWILIPIAAYAKAYRMSNNQIFDRVVCSFKWSLMALYQNPEDGIDGLRGGDPAQGWWEAATHDDSLAVRIIRWSAWRNPIGALRFVSPFGFKIDPKRMNCLCGNAVDPDAKHDADPTKTWWFYATCGAYSGLWINTPTRQYRLGWKLMPNDVNGLDPSDYRSKGCGFTVQTHAL